MSAGLCLQILAPAPGQIVTPGSDVTARIQVTLACGCPAGAGGRYDYRRFRIEAVLVRDVGETIVFSMTPGSGAGEFAGRIAVQTAGDYLLTIDAYDPESGMAGRAKTTFRVR